MYEQFNKQVVGKKVCIGAILFGLLLWLFMRPDAWSEQKSLAPYVQQVAPVESHQPLAQRLQPLEKHLETPSTPEGAPYLKSLPDFTYAAKIAIPAVVYIKASRKPQVVKRDAISPVEELFKQFFGEGILGPRAYERPAKECAGSGVIYTSNGYIVTNNHLVEDADQIEVNLNDNRSYKAKLVGTDPFTDLALLKIEACNLPALVLGSSDKLQVGEWVLAVGNPFNLYSTVTKGIVSAKSRSLDRPDNGKSEKLSIQSFIQTDAVINPGNSGGALVNLYGELVGINTAMYASMSASFMGYGFAIPSSLVKKIANDLIQYGAVQRVLLGVTIRDVDAELAKKLGLKVISGVYIDSVQDNSPCVKLLQKEDVITQINGRKINKSADLQEVIACSKPGDKVAVTLCRKGKEQVVHILLKKQPDAIQIVQKDDTLKVEGAIFQNLDAQTKKKLKLSGGVLVQEVSKGKFQAAGLKKGYILLAFDKQPVASIASLAEMIRRTTEPVLIQVMEPNKGTISYLAVELGGSSCKQK
ncbi:MAG: Do family serine endopeptidase [Candidatus Cardinium sp.]|uniref:Do family serine endopeptidase n=1 Tax=Cardinium endosymbiont of Dermatophagoides farinae TaxID=2597823 RepID=UPI001182D1D1|nr:Do family serine endopeptidase [Cardinium endosymbiont of Dermatophagoides farinae]TSJ81243.1 Do family serine endopeptidase [Cardinium endosymbiont of Dermatophagoides farinae]UWW97299.1 MAG: Do family serine endopeptidase [Candidatus Cardinium sp.]